MNANTIGSKVGTAMNSFAGARANSITKAKKAINTVKEVAIDFKKGYNNARYGLTIVK